MPRQGERDRLAQRLLPEHGAAASPSDGDEAAERAAGSAGDEQHDGDDVGCAIPWRRLAAVVCIALAVATWVAEIQVTGLVLGGGDAYDSAYFLVWVAHVASGVFAFLLAVVFGCCLPPPRDGQPSLKQLILRPTRDTLGKTFLLSVLCNLMSWTWFVSIPLTEAMVNTVIYQSCCVWCFLISVVLLGERVTLIKVVATLATFAGVGVISNFPCKVEDAPDTTPSPSDPGAANGGYLWGDLLCLTSAMLYALYEVLIKMWSSGSHSHSVEMQHRAADPAPLTEARAGGGIVRRISDGSCDDAEGHDEVHGVGDSAGEDGQNNLLSVVESAVFVGWMGVWNLFVLWTPLALLHYSGVQPFHLPDASQVTGILIDSALEGAYLVWLVLAIAFSSPLFVTIGTVLAIPASAAVDAYLHGINCPTMSLAGTGLVVFGFASINVAIFVEGRRGWPAWL